MKTNLQIRVKNDFGTWLVQFRNDTNNPWESVDHGATYADQGEAEAAAEEWAENRNAEFVGVEG